MNLIIYFATRGRLTPAQVSSGHWFPDFLINLIRDDRALVGETLVLLGASSVLEIPLKSLLLNLSSSLQLSGGAAASFSLCLEVLFGQPVVQINRSYRKVCFV